MFRLLSIVLLLAVTSYHVTGDVDDIRCSQSKAASAGFTLARIGGRDYYINKRDEETWDDSRESCKSFGLHLVSVETEQEHQALEEFFIAFLGTSDRWRFWTSGIKEAKDNIWVWAETNVKFSLNSHFDTDGIDFNYNYCLLTRNNGYNLKYTYYSCLSYLHYICEAQETCV